MIAYNKSQLSNLLDIEQAKRYKRLELITADELKAIAQAKQPAYHHTNIFIRIGVLLLTLVLTFCTYGLMVLFFDLDTSAGFKIALLFFTVVTIAALEFFIMSKNHYASGVDDGLLYFTLICFATWIGMLSDFDSSLSLMVFALAVFLFSSFLVARYADGVVSAACYIFLLLTVFYATMQTGDVAKLIMPFVMMLVSAAAYFVIHKQSAKYEFRFWSKCFSVFKCLALLSFYAAGNYYVVREASVLFFDMQLLPGSDIPLSLFFYAFTVLVPVIYIAAGLKKKDAIILNSGLILVVAAIATIRYYYAVMPLEIALITGGIILLLTVWYIYRYLKTPVKGFTLEEDKAEPAWLTKDIEAIIIAQATAQQAAVKTNDETGFGGGKFGGGGAGADY